MGQLNQKPIFATPQAIHFELRTAENSAAYLLPKLQSMKESTPFLILLDVGTGSGAISVSFAKLTSDAQSTAIDLKQNNIYFQLAYVYDLRFADGTFDGTYCHQALCYLEDPWKVLREMLRITRIDGVVAALESDFENECLWELLS
ncbi:S-adenosyl-L-methionine-dependent methyltransferase [Hyaloscypha finlandica]|nr:S-adenosyl-L-methionine-dependent methyltransferase [Hyaloscypha finlandica]